MGEHPLIEQNQSSIEKTNVIGHRRERIIRCVVAESRSIDDPRQDQLAGILASTSRIVSQDRGQWLAAEPFESLLRPNPPLEMEETQELCLV